MTEQRTAPATVEPGRPRFHELDGLRAVAIALVVVHHSLTSSATRWLTDAGVPRLGDLVFFVTGSGVELFFVLSGIVLLRPYLRGERPFQPRVYLRRRFERLWPPYAVALLFAGLVILLARLHPTWYSKDVLPRFSVTGWLAQLGIVNLGWPSYSGAWWSLNLEVFFYLLVPVLVVSLVATRARTSPLLLFVGLAVATSLAVASFGDYSDAYLRTAALQAADPTPGGWQVVQAFLIYGPCFALGVAVARLRIAARSGWVLVAYGTFHSLLALWNPWVNIHLGFAFLYSGLVVVAMEGRGQPRGWLSMPPVLWLGERSYSLFLVHFPVFYLTNYLLSVALPSRGALYFLVSRAVGIPMAVLAAMILFTVVERRFARGLATADRFWPRGLKA